MATPPHKHEAPASALLAPDAATDPAQESLVRALRASFNILRILMFVLVILYLLSGVFRVEPGEQGLVARLGKLRINPATEGGNVYGPGWYFWMLPDPFDKKYVITGEVQSLTITTFLFQHPEAATAKNLAEILFPKADLKPGVDGAMFTGDMNLSHGRWTVEYRIDDAALFVQNVGKSERDFEPLLQRLTETAVVREAAGRTVEEVTREALDSVRRGVQNRLQTALAKLQTGVTVAQVVASTIEPGAVRDAFLDVSRAESERLALVRQAEEKATEILNRAAGDQHGELLTMIRAYGEAQLRDVPETELSGLLEQIDAQLVEAEHREAGQVAVALRAARADANEINERLRREYEEFSKLLEQRAAQPRITMLGLWSQMREEILSTNQNEVFFVPQSDEIEILVNRDVQRQRELEEQRILERQMRER